MRSHISIHVVCSLGVWIGMWTPGNASTESLAYPADFPAPLTQVLADSTPLHKSCPSDLSSLQAEMEQVLQFVNSSLIKNTLLASLQASIPEAVAQLESLPDQIAFLKQEIIRQEQERSHAEEVARAELDDPSKALLPCPQGMEESYCYAVDQYYAAMAANLANQGFLEALECYYHSRGH